MFMQENPKPTLWERIKMFFGRKRYKIEFKIVRPPKITGFGVWPQIDREEIIGEKVRGRL